MIIQTIYDEEEIKNGASQLFLWASFDHDIIYGDEKIQGKGFEDWTTESVRGCVDFFAVKIRIFVESYFDLLVNLLRRLFTF